MNNGHDSIFNNLPHSDAQSISELNFFLYFLISGMSFRLSGVVGFTLTEMLEPRLIGANPGALGDVGLAPKPNAEKDVCLRMGDLTVVAGALGLLLIARRY